MKKLSVFLLAGSVNELNVEFLAKINELSSIAVNLGWLFENSISFDVVSLIFLLCKKKL